MLLDHPKNETVNNRRYLGLRFDLRRKSRTEKFTIVVRNFSPTHFVSLIIIFFYFCSVFQNIINIQQFINTIELFESSLIINQSVRTDTPLHVTFTFITESIIITDFITNFRELQSMKNVDILYRYVNIKKKKNVAFFCFFFELLQGIRSKSKEN